MSKLFKLNYAFLIIQNILRFQLTLCINRNIFHLLECNNVSFNKLNQFTNTYIPFKLNPIARTYLTNKIFY